VVEVATDIIVQFIATLGVNAQRLLDAGLWLITTLLLGIRNNIITVLNIVAFILDEFINEVGRHATRIATSGADVLIKFLKGMSDNFHRILKTGVDVTIKFIEGVGSNSLKVANAAADTLVSFLNGLAEAIRTHSTELREAGVNIAVAIADGVTFGLASKAGDAAKSGFEFGKKAVGGLIGAIVPGSPSKVTTKLGESMAEGLAVALSKDKTAENSAVILAERILTNLQASLARIPDTLENMNEFNPVITPVLDLTRVSSASKDIGDMMKVATISPTVTFDKARLISATTNQEDSPAGTTEQTIPSGVTFEQNIYSPTALSTNDIYRNTKSQIALAKEELGI
jgi:hypothetical protein